jgi:hypothetical protein
VAGGAGMKAGDRTADTTITDAKPSFVRSLPPLRTMAPVSAAGRKPLGAVRQEAETQLGNLP